MAIIENTASNTITFTQFASEGGNRNPVYTGLMGNPQGAIGGFNFLTGRDELYDFTAQVGNEKGTNGNITVGMFSGEPLGAEDLTSELGVSRSLTGEGFTIGFGVSGFTGTLFTLTASNTITFTTDVADVDVSKPRTASHTLTFSQTNVKSGPITLTAGNTVTFAHSHTAAVPKPVTAGNTITFTQLSSSGLLSRTASNSIVFTQAVGEGDTNVLTASNTISFSQTVGPGLLSRTASNSVVFSQSAFEGTILVTGITLTASSTVTFSQTNNRGLIFATADVLTASNTVAFTQRAIFPIELTAGNTVVFTQSTIRNTGKGASSTIVFTQTVVANAWRNLTASNTIAFRHGFSAIQFRDNVPVVGTEGCDATKLYAPFSGGGGSLVRSVEPALNRKTDVVFFTPVGPVCGATESITLRTPNFGDRDRNTLNRIQRESRGGSLMVFRDPKWPKERTLVMSFSGIKDSEVDGILVFLENTIGQEISFRDWNSRVWSGIITNPDSAITRTGSDRNDIALEMEVVDSGLELNACNTITFTQTNSNEVV